MSEGVVLSEGFFVQASLPSEGLLREIFRDDEEIIGRITKMLDLAPSRLINRFKTLRRKFYQKLNEYTVKTQRLHGVTIYFLPKRFAEPFLRFVEELREEYRELEEEIAEYLEDEDETETIRRYLESKGMTLKNTVNVADRFMVFLVPVSFNVDFIKSSEVVRDFVGRQVKEMADAFREEIERKVGEVINSLADFIVSMEKVPRNAKSYLRRLDRIEELARDVGVETSAFKLAREILEGVENGSITEAVDRAAEECGVEGEDFIEKMVRISEKLGCKPSPRVKELLEAL